MGIDFMSFENMLENSNVTDHGATYLLATTSSNVSNVEGVHGNDDGRPGDASSFTLRHK
jgi:hypothetical protein